MQIQSPKSHITDLGARPYAPFVPFVPSVPDVRDVRSVSDVSVVRDVRDVRGVSGVRGVSANARCPKKTEHQEMRNAVSEARASARAYLRVRKSEYGIRNSNIRLKPGLKTFYHPVRQSGVHPSLSRRGAFGIGNSRKPGLKTRSRFMRFTCFKCFRCFISFIRFNRFRCIHSWQKMKQKCHRRWS